MMARAAEGTADTGGSGTELRPLPVTARGRRSRRALLDAAKVVFARDGFADARITEIADTAKVAHGSFYTYFSSKEEIFIALLHELEDELRSPMERAPRADAENEHGNGIFESIRRANLAYLKAYWENHEVMIVWEQVATLNDEVEGLRRSAGDRFAKRIEDAVRRWQELGFADPDLDPAYAAGALTGMVSNFVYRGSARGKFDVRKAADQLSVLWANAIGVRVPEHRR